MTKSLGETEEKHKDIYYVILYIFCDTGKLYCC